MDRRTAGVIRMRVVARLSVLAAAVLVLASCGGNQAASEAPRRIPGFEEVAEKSGVRFHMTFLEGEQGKGFKINLYDHGSGVCVGDYNGDGNEDFYILNQLGRNALFRNNGDGSFSETANQAKVGVADRVCISAAFGDYDNDGDQDLYVSSVRGGNLLFRNDGKGRFEDVSEAAGVGLVSHTQGVTWFDIDADGDLDLYVTNTAKWTLEVKDPEGRYYLGASDLFGLVQSPGEKNVLFRNNGDGTFTDATEEVGVGGKSWGGDVAQFDYDDDGDLDLFVTNMFGSSYLYRNDGGGKHFTIVTKEVLGRTPWGAVACKVLDYDRDGLLDLLVIDMHSDMWMRWDLDTTRVEEWRKYDSPIGPSVEWGDVPANERADYLTLLGLEESVLPDYLFGTALYHNLGGGRYEEVSGPAGIESLWPWGIGAADFDMDGYEDVFIASGMGFPYPAWSNRLFMNARNGTFVRRAKEEGIDPRPGGMFLDGTIADRPIARSSRSVSVFDYDGDSRPDLVVNNFNDRAFLYRNRFPLRNSVGLRLEGRRSNRDAVGAVVRLTANGSVMAKQVPLAGGYLSQDTRTLLFGLGDGNRIDRCEITWPDGHKQEVKGLEVGKVTRVVEE